MVNKTKSKIYRIIDLIRSLQRPFLIFGVVGTIIGLTIFLSIKFPSADLAREAFVALMATGATITGFLFRDRVKK